MNLILFARFNQYGFIYTPSTKTTSRFNFVYDAGIDHYADGRTKSRMKGRKSAPYSYVNPNVSQPAPEASNTKLSKS